MKFLHLSDLHIGLRLMDHDLSEDQRAILDQIVDIAAGQQPGAIVIAGDIYDRSVPSSEAVGLFDTFICALIEAVPEARIMLISGNHDSGARLNLFRNVLRHQRVHMIGLPPLKEGEPIEKITLSDEWGPVHFYLLPFVKPSMIRHLICREDEGPLSYDESVRRLLDRERIDTRARNVLVSHQFYVPEGISAEQMDRADSEILTVGNIDQVSARVLLPFDYAALGHIHKPMRVGEDRFRYSGTPLACSVSEAGQQKGVVAVELREKGDVRIDTIPLRPLREVRVVRGNLEEVLQRGCDDYVTVILTDPAGPDAPDARDRLAAAFPHLLEIRREAWQQADPGIALTARAALEPFDLCRAFLGELSDEEQALLVDVINTVKEAQ